MSHIAFHAGSETMAGSARRQDMPQYLFLNFLHLPITIAELALRHDVLVLAKPCLA